jgi:hypothetical protein
METWDRLLGVAGPGKTQPASGSGMPPTKIDEFTASISELQH